MSDRLQPVVWRRIAREQRAIVIPLLILVVVNVLVYAAFIYPLSRRVNTVTERTQAAERELTNARLAHMRAASALMGRAEASQEIETFYGKVLPVDHPAARRMFFPRLQAAAREVRVRAESVDSEVRTPGRDETLTQMRVRMDLTGTYGAIREFIHRLEHAEDFLVIDGLELSDTAGSSAVLTVRIALSTYFRRPTS
jgi:hypothetical protein